MAIFHSFLYVYQRVCHIWPLEMGWCLPRSPNPGNDAGESWGPATWWIMSSIKKNYRKPWSAWMSQLVPSSKLTVGPWHFLGLEDEFPIRWVIFRVYVNLPEGKCYYLWTKYGQDGGAARGSVFWLRRAEFFLHFGMSADCLNGWRDLFLRHKTLNSKPDIISLKPKSYMTP